MKPHQAWERLREMRPRQVLAALWRRVHLRWTVLLAVVAVASGWVWFLLPPALYYCSRLLQIVVDRILWSVRAKLAAFYLNAAVVPFLLFMTVLFLFGYLVLWNITARVVERRLLSLATWSEVRSQEAEEAWWQARTAGADVLSAAELAAAAGWGSVELPGLALWVRQPSSDRLLFTRGRPESFAPLRSPWLEGHRFAGLTMRGAQRNLELRSSVLLHDAAGDIEIGSAWLITTDVLNAGLVAENDNVHGDVGRPNRPLHWSKSRSDSAAVASGILAIYEPAAADTTQAPAPTTAIDDPQQTSQVDRQRARIQSSYPVLLGHYLGHPVDWRSGRTRDGGPPILIAFSVEAGVEALLSTSYEAETVVVWGALTIVAVLLSLLLFATIRGLLYGRSIAASVAKLDQGVRAIQRGNFHFRIEPREKDQLGALAHGFNGMAQQLEGLLEEQAEHRVVERELEIARAVQGRLFPQQEPKDESVEVVGVCVPARSVSGDYYDFIPVRGGWDLVVADVSGKGMSAALLMASLQAALRGNYGSALEAPPDPAAALNRLNRHLHDYAEATRFVTLFLVRYIGGGEVVYCNAGHNPALHIRAGKATWLQQGGLMLGPFPERDYASYRLPVQAGDLLCLYTDGVTEAMDPQGELYGDERLARLLQEKESQPVQEIRQAVLDSVLLWQQGGSVTDDVTLVLLRIGQGSG